MQENCVHLACNFEYSQNKGTDLAAKKNATRLVSIIPHFDACWNKMGLFFSSSASHLLDPCNCC